MEVSFAFLCDYADQSGSKMSAIGVGIDTIYARSVPTTHPLLFAVIGLQFTSVETGQKQIGIRVIDSDGNNVVPPLDGTVNVEPPPSGYTYRTQRIALGLHGIPFQHYGDYSIRWLVGGQEVKSAPVKVAPPPAPPSTA